MREDKVPNEIFFQASTSHRSVSSSHTVKFLFFHLLLTFSLFGWGCCLCLFPLIIIFRLVWLREETARRCVLLHLHSISSLLRWTRRMWWIRPYATFCTSYHIIHHMEISTQRFRMKSTQVFILEAPGNHEVFLIWRNLLVGTGKVSLTVHVGVGGCFHTDPPE